MGVVGVVELDFLEPIHNKQDFNKDDRYKYVVIVVVDTSLVDRRNSLRNISSSVNYSIRCFDNKNTTESIQ